MPNKPKTSSGVREPISENIGAYLFNIRMIKNVSRESLAAHLNLSVHSIRNVENNELSVPPMRLKLWLDFLDASDHYSQIRVIMRTRKTQRKFNYTINNKANEHIDRLIDCYERNSLTIMDIALLKMIAPYEYNQATLDITPTTETKDLDTSTEADIKKSVTMKKLSLATHNLRKKK